MRHRLQSRTSSVFRLHSGWKAGRSFFCNTDRSPPYEEADAALAERLAERRLAAEAEARSTEALPAPVALPSPRGPVFAEDESLPEGWETRLAARRVEDTPEAREDAFLDSLGEESQE